MSSIKHSEIFNKILNIDTENSSKGKLVKIIKELQVKVKEQHLHANNLYKKDYYKNRGVSVARRTINNAKSAIRKLDKKTDKYKMENQEKRIDIGKKMIELYTLLADLLPQRKLKKDKIKVAILEIKQLKENYKKLVKDYRSL